MKPHHWRVHSLRISLEASQQPLQPLSTIQSTQKNWAPDWIFQHQDPEGLTDMTFLTWTNHCFLSLGDQMFLLYSVRSLRCRFLNKVRTLKITFYVLNKKKRHSSSRTGWFPCWLGKPWLRISPTTAQTWGRCCWPYLTFQQKPRQRFWATPEPSRETLTEMYHRLKGLQGAACGDHHPGVAAAGWKCTYLVLSWHGPRLKHKPFGLHGVPATFQKVMGRILQSCED